MKKSAEKKILELQKLGWSAEEAKNLVAASQRRTGICQWCGTYCHGDCRTTK